MTWLPKEYVLCKMMQVSRNVCLSECKCQHIPVSELAAFVLRKSVVAEFF